MSYFSNDTTVQPVSVLEDPTQIAESKKELEAWKVKVEKADDVKTRLVMEKLEEEEAKRKAKEQMMTYANKRQECEKKFNENLKEMQSEVCQLGKRKQDLMDKLKRCQAELEAKRSESMKLRQKFKINAQIPDTEVKFTQQNKENGDDDTSAIRGVFTISQRPSVLLRGGQALITFEEEKVVSQILKIPKCSVSCENITLDVKPKRIAMDPVVKFEVHLDISKKDLKVANVPPLMPEERIKDRLEISFSRPSRGGGEVESVDYHKATGTGLITFLHPGVAEGLALKGRYEVDLDTAVTVQVTPLYKYQLRKFQTFCGTPKRTLLLDDIEDIDDIDDDEEIQDHVEIHFQKPNNYGGEIESIKYISGGKVLQAFFSEDTV
ncbi:N-myc-interactor [Sphaeramia orbicularis]|uniref:NID domain-containing protein n=1 Tax=Sphaeramia orbicularis TaxID=375764 RepID=A0A673AKL9_9TELE|nr:N-myc-interactor [Sphaeramia orbicularis]